MDGSTLISGVSMPIVDSLTPSADHQQSTILAARVEVGIVQCWYGEGEMACD
jgi:hypothetical protein